MNLISFSLFGSNESYYRGALANLRLAPDIYPGWQPVIWLEGSKAGWKDILENHGAAVMLMPESRGLEGVFWRLLAPYLQGAERILFRDTDSRLNPREAAAVAAWLASDKDFHVMRDHPCHQLNHPILAGMWAAKASALDHINAAIESWPRRTDYGDDQDLLHSAVWPLLTTENSLQHNGTSGPWLGEQFSPHKYWSGHVGQKE